MKRIKKWVFILSFPEFAMVYNFFDFEKIKTTTPISWSECHELSSCNANCKLVKGVINYKYYAYVILCLKTKKIQQYLLESYYQQPTCLPPCYICNTTSHKAIPIQSSIYCKWKWKWPATPLPLPTLNFLLFFSLHIYGYMYT